MAITVSKEVVITDGLIGKVNGGTVTGNASFNGLYHNRTYTIDSLASLTYNLNTDVGNYFTTEITSGSPIIKYLGMYTANTSGSSTITLPDNAGVDDKILVVCSSPTIDNIYMVDKNNLLEQYYFVRGTNMCRSEATMIDKYRKVLINNHSANDIISIFIIKNCSKSNVSSNTAIDTASIPDPAAIPQDSMQALGLVVLRMAQADFTASSPPPAPTGMVLLLWTSTDHTVMIAYRNIAPNASFDPPALSTLAIQRWQSYSISVKGLTSFTSSNSSITISGNGSCIFDVRYFNGSPAWSTSILWPNNTQPVFTAGSRYLFYFQKALNNKWLAVQYPR